MLALIEPGNLVIALDVLGLSWSTEQLAKAMSDWRNENQRVDFLIGGPEGLSAQCLQQAKIKLSLSAFTFPHMLVRVIIAEQLYRASCILQNHPYHRT
jgi:23S rRNA (pseudouridine1915-N3)-methyltransferase